MRRWCQIRRPPRAISRMISRAKRYKWVKKKMERTDVVAGEGETIVYNLGTLYGEWPDGTPFDGNRYVDRFVVRDGKIVQMDVWNDSAERLLLRAGIDG
jgi:ketosteroid isomerase-like protein